MKASPLSGARLARVAGVAVTMPRRWYQEQIASGAITDADLSEALASAPAALAAGGSRRAEVRRRVPTPDSRTRCRRSRTSRPRCPGIDWPGLIAERFGAWAAGYFDEGQALWAAPRGRGAYAAWRAVATHDLTPEIVGLPGFATPCLGGAGNCAGRRRARRAAARSLSRGGLETYFHQMLMTLGGWAQYARYRLWQAELGGGSDRDHHRLSGDPADLGRGAVRSL